MPTIKDVAARAGVSAATVSRVLSGSLTVDATLRDRVHKVVAETGYTPNRVARGLRRQTSAVWGLVIADIQNPFFTGLVRGVEDVASATGHSVVLCNSDEDADKEAHYVNVLMAEQVGGLLVTPADERRTTFQAARAAGIPVVTVDRRVEHGTVDAVLVDNHRAGREAVQHLLDSGAEDIAVVVGDDRITTARQRLDGARQALAAHHLRLPDERVLRASPTGRGAVELVQAALSRAPRPDAIFATNNQVTIASLLAVSRWGLRMPEDLLFVGFDDLPLAELYGSGLTLVDQPTYDLGRRAAELLMERLQGMDGPAREVLLTPRLTVRGSSVRSSATRLDSLAGGTRTA